MNALLEIVVIASVVGVAALFVTLRVIKALRGGRPSCCSDTGETGPVDRTASCTDADTRAAGGQGAGNLASRPSYCAGCTGCGPRL